MTTPTPGSGYGPFEPLGNLIVATKPVKPTAPPPAPPSRFAPASLERMTLRHFYGWTERGARNARRFVEYRPSHPPGESGDPDSPDPARN